MLLVLLQTDENYTWLAPYGYAIVLMGFLFFFFRVFESLYANWRNKPLVRQWVSYKKLPAEHRKILEEEFYFYSLLSKRHKRQFRHRVASFLNQKQFVPRDSLQLTERKKILIASVGCMLSFGRKNYNYNLIKYILIYPKAFYSSVNDAYHKGEFNPGGRALVLSWEDFEIGYEITNDNRNLGIHEFMHAMQLEAKKGRDIDSSRFLKEFQKILKRLTHNEVKNKLDETRFFREYAFTNQYEFMAVITEYFIESPEEFKQNFPQLYQHIKNVLNFRFIGY